MIQALERKLSVGRRLQLLKYALLCVIFFLLTFCYDILHSTKVILVLSQEAGAEVIPFLKIWGIMPATVLMTFVFAKLSRRMNMERVFYSMLGLFIAFFVLFNSVLFPFRDALTLDNDSLLSLSSFLPAGAKGLVSMVKYWHISLYYLFADLWGNIILNMLFWGFINEMTRFADAKRFYGVFIFGANIAPMVAARYCIYCQRPEWPRTLGLFVTTIILSSLMILGLFFLVNRLIFLERRLGGANKAGSGVVDKSVEASGSEAQGFTLYECLRAVKTSRYLRYLAFVVLSYYMIYNLTDVLWTDQLGKRFGSDQFQMTNYLNNVSFAKGLLATVFALFFSGNIIRKFGWFPAALVTPGILALTSAMFFPLVLSEHFHFADVFAGLISTPLLQAVVFIGAVQHCLVRASKYTIFDATKEMAFIPLSSKDQRMGKAVIDGLGARVGKAAGSFFIQVLLFLFGGLAASIPYLAVITAILVGLWIFSISRLRLEIQARVDEKI